jgi:hypothetical protein
MLHHALPIQRRYRRLSTPPGSDFRPLSAITFPDWFTSGILAEDGSHDKLNQKVSSES